MGQQNQAIRKIGTGSWIFEASVTDLGVKISLLDYSTGEPVSTISASGDTGVRSLRNAVEWAVEVWNLLDDTEGMF